jgi:tRNA-2-methylthio-N6-dimethylallyladenosine synthase
MTSPKRGSTTTAWVNIIYGCNEHCTYCVVPATRGVEQSRPKEAVLAEVAALVAEGFREVTLLGQNVDAWGRDMTPKQLFADLLASVAKVPGLARVRFVTSHPVRETASFASSSFIQKMRLRNTQQRHPPIPLC